MYNYDITKYLESLEIKNNFLSGLLSMQPPTREIIGQTNNATDRIEHLSDLCGGYVI